MASSDLLPRIEAAKRAVLSQVDLMHRQLGRVESVWKSDGTRVTAVDIEISENIFRELSKLFPKDQFFSEELAGVTGPIPVTATHSWVLDPIDGTNNYALGLPYCAISLGLLENGIPVYGIVYDMSRRVLMHGGPGFGMFDGDKPGRIATGRPSRETLVAMHSPFDKSLSPMSSAVISQFKIRGLGSATLHLAYVAAGLFDACVDFNVKVWDLAAAIPLCRAAGGDVHFLNGEQFPMRQFDLKMNRIVYVAGSPAMCDRLRELMGRA